MGAWIETQSLLAQAMMEGDGSPLIWGRGLKLNSAARKRLAESRPSYGGVD